MTGWRSTIFLLLGMLAWIAAGFVGAALAAGAAIGLSLLLRGPLDLSGPGLLLYILIATCGFQATLLLGAVWQGRRATKGHARIGLGIRPIRHPAVIAGLALGMIGWLLAFVALVHILPGLSAFARSVTPDILSGGGNGGTTVVILRGVLVTLLAPLSEELFFRGWLWESVARRGHGMALTAMLTATPWLLLHGIDSPGRVLFLLPAAAVFSLARYLGGSVLASLSVHVTNNGAAVMMQALAWFLGQDT